MNALRNTPLYRQAIDAILSRLQKGEWQPGDFLPNEFELAAQHTVSQGTMRKALDHLVEDGVLVRRQGAGTFVAEMQDCLSLASAALLGDARVSEKIYTEFASLQKTHASESIANELKIHRGAALWEIQRVIRAGTRLFAIDRVYLPESLFPSVDSKRLHHWHGNIKQMSLTDYGLHFMDGAVRYRAILPNTEIMKRLLVNKEEPLLERIRISIDRGQRPVLWGMTIFHTQQFSFSPYMGGI